MSGAEVFFITDSMVVFGIHNIFENDTYQIEKNGFSWNNYHNQRIITFCMFDLHLMSNMRKLLQWVKKDNSDYSNGFIDHKKYYFIGTLGIYNFKGELMEMLTKQCRVHVASTEKFNIRSELCPFYDKLYYVTNKINRLLGKEEVDMDKVIEQYHSGVEREIQRMNAQRLNAQRTAMVQQNGLRPVQGRQPNSAQNGQNTQGTQSTQGMQPVNIPSLPRRAYRLKAGHILSFRQGNYIMDVIAIN